MVCRAQGSANSALRSAVLGECCAIFEQFVGGFEHSTASRINQKCKLSIADGSPDPLATPATASCDISGESHPNSGPVRVFTDDSPGALDRRIK